MTLEHHAEDHGDRPVWDAYRRGAILVVEYTKYRLVETGEWIREEVHSVPGLPPELIDVHCAGPDDTSAIIESTEYERCVYCALDRIHTVENCRLDCLSGFLEEELAAQP